MGTVITVIALLFLLFVVFGAYATVKVIGAAKRGVDRTISQARRTVEDTTLRAKTFAQPGPQGELAQLRLSLRTSMRATQDALQASVAEDESLKESLSLFERLSAHGRELDAELKRLEAEPDRGTLATRLPGLRERTQRITQSADSLRWAARDRAHRFAGDDLDTLSAQIDVEAGALRHWTKEPGPAASWPDAPTADAGTSGGQTRPRSPESRPADQPGRSAITPPGQRPTYPWQKKPRPESTT
ncbi:hypothetical protein [Streptomyces sp. NPDC006290]|uniref:hypothetical protein n=1 Tax=unclassified Streptomyces TaxID=2593676 RepID=UPI0033BA1F05